MLKTYGEQGFSSCYFATTDDISCQGLTTHGRPGDSYVIKTWEKHMISNDWTEISRSTIALQLWAGRRIEGNWGVCIVGLEKRMNKLHLERI